MSRGAPSKSGLLRNHHRRLGNFTAGDHLVVTADAFVTDECALADHSPGNTRHALGSSRHNVCHLVFRPATERTVESAGFHLGNHSVGLHLAHYSLCAITSSIKPYSLACIADIILSRSTSRSTVSYD